MCVVYIVMVVVCVCGIYCDGGGVCVVYIVMVVVCVWYIL